MDLPTISYDRIPGKTKAVTGVVIHSFIASCRVNTAQCSLFSSFFYAPSGTEGTYQAPFTDQLGTKLLDIAY